MNTSTESEKEQLEIWKSENPENRELFETLVEEWSSETINQLSILGSEEVKEDIWRKLKVENSSRSHVRNTLFPKVFKFAAAILIIISFIFVIKRYEYDSEFEVPANEEIVKSNPAGQKSVIKLPDGSTINLNAESEVAYNSQFSDTARIVHLTGEAFFTIQKDESKPFYVYADKIKVKALGTSFNVKGFTDSKDLFVSLSTGKVAIDQIENSSQVIELLPGEQVIYNKTSGQFSEVTNYDRLEMESWKSGGLYFKKSNINAIVRELEKWYGVKISVGRLPENSISYTGLFRNQNLENVLTSMGFALAFDFEIEDKQVLINFKND